jgi:hypothetical protein
VKKRVDEREAAERLLALGLGFARADASGDAAVRRTHAHTVADLKKGERLAFEAAKKIARDVALDLDRCERAHVFPGPLRPEEICVDEEGGAFFAANDYVALVAPDSRDSREARDAKGEKSGPSAKWTPPEQLDGAPWDNAANRYVLGLVLYRLLAGEPPEIAGGARAAMSARRADVLPLPEEVASALPPGMHAFVLRTLSPDATKRPLSAAAIAKELEEAPAPKIAIARKNKPETRSKKNGATSTKRRGVGPLATAATLLSIAIAVVSIVTLGLGKEAEKSAVAIAPQKPLASTKSDACASCHPREVVEWRRSVMAHAAKSPLFGALESAVEEQIGRATECPNGAGILRKRGGDACFERASGVTVTGSGGEHWCVNCHLPGENLRASMPAWTAFGAKNGRSPIRDVASDASMEGISCASCHTTIGPTHGNGGYAGNPSWTSFKTGAVFASRPEDAAGTFGIGNSGYQLDEGALLGKTLSSGAARVHKMQTPDEKAYLKSSQFCGACHDVRLFGTDSLGARERGEHFKRLRNGYSEWRAWADDEARAGRRAATCQDCHMTTFPGVCVKQDGARGGEGCPPGTRFAARAPGEKRRGGGWSHDFTSVEVPLAEDPSRITPENDATLDADGVPQGLAYRQTMLVARALDFRIGATERAGTLARIPVEIANVGAGHRVPAGFSQEREIWVELSVTDAKGRLVYDVGRVARADEDLADKRFVRVRTDDDVTDAKGRPLGVFGADVIDGPDAPRWKKTAPNELIGKGLVNLQNGFLRCVRCIGFVDGEGKCQPAGDQGRTRADRFDDGDYDLDTGECRSNLPFENAFFETYFPIGALDADRGIVKAPDAIIDTRSAPPGVRQRWVYEIDTTGHELPLTVKAKLRFRAFPPYLLRAFADYESKKAARGDRPSGAQMTSTHLGRLRILDVHEAEAKVE